MTKVIETTQKGTATLKGGFTANAAVRATFSIESEEETLTLAIDDYVQISIPYNELGELIKQARAESRDKGLN